MCGGTRAVHVLNPRIEGLSPRVRGNLRRLICAFRYIRSIPACAGEPFPILGRRPLQGVYPRVCGGTNRRRDCEIQEEGLSPRVRGNRLRDDSARGIGRSIPACAGEPTGDGQRPERTEVYPRVCGGTTAAVGKTWALGGLSPRVRGNHSHLLAHTRQPRSIPACAGEPARQSGRYAATEVYPRVCGGTHLV